MQNKLKTNKNHFSIEELKIVYIESRVSEAAIKHIASRMRNTFLNLFCYDSSYASMLIAMLMTMLIIIVDRSSLNYKVVSRSTLFRVSLCFSESYR